MRRHATSLKIAFRLYAFMGAHNEAADSMGEAQFRSFVEDTQIQTYVSDHQCDLIYRRVKYNEDEAELAIAIAKSPRAHLAEHEFVHAVIRLARFNASFLLAKALERQSHLSRQQLTLRAFNSC